MQLVVTTSAVVALPLAFRVTVRMSSTARSSVEMVSPSLVRAASARSRVMLSSPAVKLLPPGIPLGASPPLPEGCSGGVWPFPLPDASPAGASGALVLSETLPPEGCSGDVCASPVLSEASSGFAGGV